MRVVDIHEAKARLSQLVEQAAAGEPFLISRGGKPVMKVDALNASGATRLRRLGFLAVPIAVPDDFDTMGATDIRSQFEGAS